MSDYTYSEVDKIYVPSRRIFLGAMAASASLGLSGCSIFQSLFEADADQQENRLVEGLPGNEPKVTKKRVQLKKRPLPLGNHDRKIKLHSIHTGESLEVTYWEQGKYDHDALRDISHLLRDHRNNRVHTIDPMLLDQIFVLRQKLETNRPFHIISGYRSAQTNQMLRKHSHGQVAKNSLHMQGRAIDIRVPGRQLNKVRLAALSIQAGGVGYYPETQFIHLDTGRVRRW